MPADYTFVSGDNGIHTFSAALNTAGTQSITAADTVNGSITGTQSGIQVNSGSSEQLYENYQDNNNSTGLYGLWTWKGQTFTPTSSHTLTKASLYLYKEGNPSGNARVYLLATDVSGNPAGVYLDSASVACSTIPGDSNFHWIDFSFSGGVQLQANTKYALALQVPSGDASNFLYTSINTSGTYTSGSMYQTGDGGESWEALGGGAWDMLFEEYGAPPSGEQVYESYTAGGNATDDFYGAVIKAQTFTPAASHNMTAVRLMLGRTGSPQGNVSRQPLGYGWDR